MSNKVSNIKEIEANVEDVNTEGVAGAVFDSLSEEDKAKLLAMVSEDQPQVEEQSKLKKFGDKVAKNKWKILGAVAGVAGAIFLGKKIYAAGMPAEFDAHADVIDGYYEETSEQYEAPEETVVEETEEVVE